MVFKVIFHMTVVVRSCKQWPNVNINACSEAYSLYIAPWTSIKWPDSISFDLLLALHVLPNVLFHKDVSKNQFDHFVKYPERRYPVAIWHFFCERIIGGIDIDPILNMRP